MHAEFRRRLAARLRALSEELAAITLSFVTTQLLQASDIEGVRLTRLCAELGRQVSVHYEREAILRYRSEQLARLETEQDERAPLHADGSVRSGASVVGDGGGVSAQSEAGLDALGAEGVGVPGGVEQLGEGEAAGAGGDTLSGRIEYRRQQVKRSRDFTDLQVRTSRKAILHLDGVDLRVRWPTVERMQLSAYLVDCLIRNTTFQPSYDEMCRARQTYWQYVQEHEELQRMQSEREAGGDGGARDGDGDDDAVGGWDDDDGWF